MTEYTIYHNPRCSKSRATLALLEDNGIAPDIILYLETPPSAQNLKQVLGYLGVAASAIVRRGEDDYKSSGLHADSTEAEVIAVLASHPKVIERPIVVRGERAVIGRPPENVLELMD